MKNPLANLSTASRRTRAVPTNTDVPVIDTAPDGLLGRSGRAEPPVMEADPTQPVPTAADADAPPEGPGSGGDEDLWPTGGPPKGIRLRLPILAVLGFVVAALGFAGGATAYKWKNPAPTVAAGALPGAPGGATGFPGAPGGANAAGGQAAPGQAAGAGARTMGTVATVDGTTIYVTDSSGNLIKVTIPEGTTVTATRPGIAADVRPGDTIVVTGSKQPDGSTQASTVALNPTAGGGAQRGVPPTTAAD